MRARGSLASAATKPVTPRSCSNESKAGKSSFPATATSGPTKRTWLGTGKTDSTGNRREERASRSEDHCCAESHNEPHSFERQYDDGASTYSDYAEEQDHRLETWISAHRQTRFCICSTEASRVCRRVFLARVSVQETADGAPPFLACEDSGKSSKGRTSQPDAW